MKCPDIRSNDFFPRHAMVDSIFRIYSNISKMTHSHSSDGSVSVCIFVGNFIALDCHLLYIYVFLYQDVVVAFHIRLSSAMQKFHENMCAACTSRTNLSPTDAMYLINNFQHTKMYPTEFNLSSCALDTLSLQQNAVFLFQWLSTNVRPAEEGEEKKRVRSEK